ncbi:MAG: hypothetical protein ACO3LF_02610 [Candidatus Kariarchaeum pelagius]|jgi:hypothetical protein
MNLRNIYKSHLTERISSNDAFDQIMEIGEMVGFEKTLDEALRQLSDSHLNLILRELKRNFDIEDTM